MIAINVSTAAPAAAANISTPAPSFSAANETANVTGISTPAPSIPSSANVTVNVTGDTTAAAVAASAATELVGGPVPAPIVVTSEASQGPSTSANQPSIAPTLVRRPVAFYYTFRVSVCGVANLVGVFPSLSDFLSTSWCVLPSPQLTNDLFYSRRALNCDIDQDGGLPCV